MLLDIEFVRNIPHFSLQQEIKKPLANALSCLLYRRRRRM
jgi:hypothetical protein